MISVTLFALRYLRSIQNVENSPHVGVIKRSLQMLALHTPQFYCLRSKSLIQEVKEEVSIHSHSDPRGRVPSSQGQDYLYCLCWAPGFTDKQVRPEKGTESNPQSWDVQNSRIKELDKYKPLIGYVHGLLGISEVSKPSSIKVWKEIGNRERIMGFHMGKQPATARLQFCFLL